MGRGGGGEKKPRRTDDLSLHTFAGQIFDTTVRNVLGYTEGRRSENVPAPAPAHT
ncbi:hypothetical protein QF035_007539 [Streptomyces umbrinus]|uniref:Uncharacterized protein n=1 Tax=Streptomyces umbrinus TaxID=67370 RepID=A0ABU0T2B5_9ACTN|nr:hypothetical protein [Streptomyces umbrinus]